MTGPAAPRVVTTEADRDALAAILGHAFAVDPAPTERWLARVAPDDLYVSELDGRVAGGFAELPMGLWLGGRAVPMMGIAGVGVALWARRRGVAAAMMRDNILAQHARGWPLAGLYASSQPLYRKAGYEQAGGRYAATVRPGELGVEDRELRVRPLTDADDGRVQALYAAHAALRPGHLDRGPYAWARVTQANPSGVRARGYGVHPPERPDALEGYTFYRQTQQAGGGYELAVIDLVATTARAARRLWTLYADHGTLGSALHLWTAPSDPLLLALPAQTVKPALRDAWMIRVVDARRALAARGYPPGLRASVELELDDDLVAANRGRVVLEIDGGAATVREGGAGTVQASIRGLATMLTGFTSPRAAALAGLVEGPAEALDALGAALAGPAPWMPDMF